MVDERRWTEYELRGGSFVDDISDMDLWLKAEMLEDCHGTCHADIGFRIAAAVNLSEFPQNVQAKLNLEEHQLPSIWIEISIGRRRYKRERSKHRSDL